MMNCLPDVDFFVFAKCFPYFLDISRKSFRIYSEKVVVYLITTLENRFKLADWLVSLSFQTIIRSILFSSSSDHGNQFLFISPSRSRTRFHIHRLTEKCGVPLPRLFVASAKQILVSLSADATHPVQPCGLESEKHVIIAVDGSETGRQSI